MITHERAFRIRLNQKDVITLEQALVLARKHDIDCLVYDAEGLYNKNSWHWCASILEVLQQEDLIREFDVLTPPPMLDEPIQAKEGEVIVY